MKIKEPSQSEIFREMKANGCCWLGGHGCQCHCKCNWNGCFVATKEHLTKVEYTEAEVKQQQVENEKFCNEVDEMLALLVNGNF